MFGRSGIPADLGAGPPGEAWPGRARWAGITWLAGRSGLPGPGFLAARDTWLGGILAGWAKAGRAGLTGLTSQAGGMAGGRDEPM